LATMQDVAKKRQKRTIIRSEDDVEWEVVYADPSRETKEIYEDLMLFLYRYGVEKGYFIKQPPPPKPT